MLVFTGEREEEEREWEWEWEVVELEVDDCEPTTSESGRASG